MRTREEAFLLSVVLFLLFAVCSPVEEGWVRNGFKVAKSDRYAKGPEAAAAEVLRRFPPEPAGSSVPAVQP